jgi:hypothetical protein
MPYLISALGTVGVMATGIGSGRGTSFVSTSPPTNSATDKKVSIASSSSPVTSGRDAHQQLAPLIVPLLPTSTSFTDTDALRIVVACNTLPSSVYQSRRLNHHHKRSGVAGASYLNLDALINALRWVSYRKLCVALLPSSFYLTCL